MNHGLTPSEKFVSELCERSFMKLWTHPNPTGKKGKELCDCLVVCGHHIVIISVKENEYKDTGNKIGWERWQKVAIEKSVSQIIGAERWLESVTEVTRRDGRILNLPPKLARKYHRVSVSLGGKGQVPLKWGDFGSGFIHVCDEHSVGILFGVFDTITDFINFLTSTEKLITSDTQYIFSGGGIEDIAALYLSNGSSLDHFLGLEEQPDLVIFGESIWGYYSESEDFKIRQEDFRSSYIWDKLIEHYSDDLLTDGMFDMHSKQVTDNQLALVQMALQPRGYRANLADAFLEFLQKPELKVASRVVEGYGSTVFVFLIGSSADREFRSRELALRCLVIRGIVPNITTVVGIATDRPNTSEIGYSSDILYLHMTEWTEEYKMKVSQIQSELGYFENTKWIKNKQG